MARSGHQKLRKNDENSHWTPLRKIGDGDIGTGKVPEDSFFGSAAPVPDLLGVARDARGHHRALHRRAVAHELRSPQCAVQEGDQ